MKISTKGRYGLRAMLDLAVNGGKKNVPLAAISERQDLSIGYLESLFSMLKKAGLVSGEAGSGGGYSLRMKSENITVKQILSVLEGDLSVTGQVISNEEISPIRRFLSETVWDQIDEKVLAVFERTTLAELSEEYLKKEQAQAGSLLLPHSDALK